MSKKSKKEKLNKEALELSSDQWILEVADTYDRTEPNRQLTGLLASEDEAREKASELAKEMGPFEKMYVVGPNNLKYPWR